MGKDVEDRGYYDQKNRQFFKYYKDKLLGKN